MGRMPPSGSVGFGRNGWPRTVKGCWTIVWSEKALKCKSPRHGHEKCPREVNMLCSRSRFMSEHHLTDKSFAGLNLPEPLLRGVHEAGFEHCTPLQAEALPLALAGQDVAGQAQTRTGKTAAFLLAAFTHLLRHLPEDRRPTHPRAIMLAPTRELAVQIHK